MAVHMPSAASNPRWRSVQGTRCPGRLHISPHADRLERRTKITCNGAWRYMVLRSRVTCLHDGIYVSDRGGGRDVTAEGTQLLAQQLGPSRAIPVHAVVHLRVTMVVVYDNSG